MRRRRQLNDGRWRWGAVEVFALLALCPAFGRAQGLAERAPRFAGMVNEAALGRLKALPPPIQSSDGKVFVGVTTPERAALRWPVLRFVDTVRGNFAEVFLPLGSTESPLSLELGSVTNRVETVERRTLRTPDGFSQLIIRVPNPETVDLDVLRLAVVEALLREQARSVGGSYGSFTWPEWFLSAAVDASRGGVWRAEAYERLRAAGDTPQTAGWRLDDFFSSTPPPREAAAFFAQWLFQRAGGRTVKQRMALLTAPWTRASIVGGATDSEWRAWLLGQEDTVFMPGVLTRSQFTRWVSELKDPKTAEEAMAQSKRLSRFAVGRPQAFRDLTELYLRAYAAAALGQTETYAELRAQADEAKTFLETYLRRNPVLSDEAKEADSPSSASLSSPSLSPEQP